MTEDKNARDLTNPPDDGPEHYRPSKALQLVLQDVIKLICKTGGDDNSWRRFWMTIGILVGEAEHFTFGKLVPKAVPDQELAGVAGNELLGTLAEHEQACRVLLTEEQNKPLPDNHLISTLCNSVRLSREYAIKVASRFTESPGWNQVVLYLAEVMFNLVEAEVLDTDPQHTVGPTRQFDSLPETEKQGWVQKATEKSAHIFSILKPSEVIVKEESCQ